MVAGRMCAGRPVCCNLILCNFLSCPCLPQVLQWLVNSCSSWHFSLQCSLLQANPPAVWWLQQNWPGTLGIREKPWKKNRQRMLLASRDKSVKNETNLVQPYVGTLWANFLHFILLQLKKIYVRGHKKYRHTWKWHTPRAWLLGQAMLDKQVTCSHL